MVDNLKSGNTGEETAVRFLEEIGYRIVARNFHFGRLVEIDIIAEDGEFLVFVEVKYSSSLKYGYPEQRVTRSKLNKIKKAAEGWMLKNGIENRPCRIDVIGILNLNGTPEITHLENVI